MLSGGVPTETNRRFVLASRPEGEPTEQNFRLETQPVPKPGENELLVKNLWLSVDPYMRGRMSDRASYAKPVGIGEVMVGGTVGRVEKSRSSSFSEGDIVVGYGGWQEYSVLQGDATGAAQVFKVPSGAEDPPISTALGVCGMPGATAYFGLLKLGAPKDGETVVVSAASGAVGSVVGQIAKMRGARAVGIAGGAEKCGFCVDELGFDACVDYKSEPDLAAAIARACPKGVDVYFENVGGPVSVAVASQLNAGSRVPICGVISQYNSVEAFNPMTVLEKAAHPATGRFFLVWEWPEEYPAAIAELQAWVRSGKLKYREDVVEGFENTPKAFIGLFSGSNFGKRVVRI